MTDEEQTDEDILTEQTEADRRKYISRTDSLRIEEGEEHVKKKNRYFHRPAPVAIGVGR
jgi:uncharacterized protein involved in tellurium resistance